MKGNLLCFFCMVLVFGFVFSAACTSSPSPGGPVVATLSVTPSAATAPLVPTLTPAATPSQSPPVTTSPAGRAIASLPVSTNTQVPQTTVKETSDDPQILALEFTKNYFNADIPDCGMRAVLPQVAADPGYGIQPPKSYLVAIPKDLMLAFITANIKDYAPEPTTVERYVTHYLDPNLLGGTSCSGVPAQPAWNVVRIDLTIIPRNARPANYDIGIDVRSQGRTAAQITMNRNLTLDTPVSYELYVPLKTAEMDRFDSIAMNFTKQS
ncbi:hypothetical protein [Methanoregula sp.]|uniref:hypothetical protein n=1 Tax=Methanoregula sp. TaxID=2052170 RepID=UPI0035632EDC